MVTGDCINKAFHPEFGLRLSKTCHQVRDLDDTQKVWLGECTEVEHGGTVAMTEAKLDVSWMTLCPAYIDS